MSVDVKAIVKGNLNAIELAQIIDRVYGGMNFNIDFGINFNHTKLMFDERHEDDNNRSIPLHMREKGKRRMMHVFTNGECACDYADVTTEPMTYVSLGHTGDAVGIMTLLVAELGGWIYDEAKNETWVELDDAQRAEAASFKKAEPTPLPA